MNTIKDLDVIYSVPDSMQRLVRFTVRGFYGIEHGLTIDVLIRNACVKEEDIQRLLLFDKKQLRAILNQLKSDKFLKSRLHVETQENGKVSRHNYYFINYRSIANIIKYKLHKMHKILETRERDLSNRPSFKCPTCGNTYDDLDVSQLLDPMMGTLNCIFCKSEVREEKDTANSQDIRTSQARFNEQTEVLYKLLKDVEGINLAEELLEPKPAALNLNNLPGKTGTKSATRNRTEPNWSTKPDSRYGYVQNITINMSDEKKNVNNGKTTKEQPSWLVNSTVTPDMTIRADIAGVSDEKIAKMDDDVINSGDSAKASDENEVMKWLIMNERPSKSAPTTSAASTSNVAASLPSRAAESSDDEDDFDDVEDEEEAIVMVAGKSYSYHEVASRGQELIQLMSEKEKEAYIEMGQQFYQDMND